MKIVCKVAGHETDQGQGCLTGIGNPWRLFRPLLGSSGEVIMLASHHEFWKWNCADTESVGQSKSCGRRLGARRSLEAGMRIYWNKNLEASDPMRTKITFL